MKRLSLPVVGCVVIVVLSLIGLASRSTSAPSVAPPVASATGLRTQVFTVAQMTCATCPITVRTAMAAVKGVSAVVVDFDTKQATVTFDPLVATPQQIADASTNAGYPAKPAL